MNKLLLRNFSQALIFCASLLAPHLTLSQAAAPLVRLWHEETPSPINAGTLPVTFSKSAIIPASTSNVAPGVVVGEKALDFGTTIGNYYVQSSAVLDGLKNLSAFTLTGWVNARSLTAGSGGNRIISWINNGGDGVDLVLQSNGSLRLGVDGWPDNSPAVSSANKVTASATAATQNWIFFAVTYQSNGQVRFYFGNSANDAILDVSRTYTAGVTGSSIGKLAIGAFNDNTRNAATWDRMFRGVVDDLRIYGSALSTTDIVTVQRTALLDDVTPSAPSNLRTTFVNPTSIGLAWDAGIDNVGIANYEIYDNTTLLATVGNVTSYTLTGLESGRTYNIALRSKDARGNTSILTASLPVVTGSIEPNAPLLYLHLNDIAGGTPANVGVVQGPTFSTGTGPSNTYLPGSSLETPPYVGGSASADFGVTPGNAFIESQAPIDQLKALSSFTITGWVNCKSSVAGSGGNRIVSWINNGGDGVDLVYQSNGSLRLGVDGWPDNSPAFSNANKVTTNASAPQSNWVFFAVTYQSNGQVQYYFGTNAAKATLDATRTYSGPGVTGSNIGKFAIGAFNSTARNAATYDRMFRGLIDDIRVFGSVLSLSDIIGVQGKTSTDITPPPAPSNFASTSKTVSTIALSWTAPTDNTGAIVNGYKIYNNGVIIANLLTTNITTSSYTLTGLTPNTIYNLTIKAEDAAGNLSVASNAISVTTDATGVPLAIIDTKFEEGPGFGFRNEGTATSSGFDKTPNVPSASFIVPNVPNDIRSADFGTVPGDNYISSYSAFNELASLGSFTLTGWLNNRSNTIGAGGNRIISWTNNGGDGVDLVVQSDGSLRLGVDEFASNSPALSSASKITTDVNAGSSNWVFFAVTYQSNGQVQFYFGNNTTDAVLDVTRNYAGRGAVGSNIGKLAFGSVNGESKTATTIQNMFRGLIDNFKIYGSSLSLSDIRAVQHGVSSDVTPPSAPSALTVTNESGTSVALSWTASTDNIAVVDYNIYDSNTLVETTRGPNNTVTVGSLIGGGSYQFSVKARDAAGNLSAASNVVAVATKKLPLVRVTFDDYSTNALYGNTGTLGGFVGGGQASTLSPNGSAPFSMKGATNSQTVYDGLKNLSAFTITGWVNRTSNDDAEQILGWMPSGGGDGVQLTIGTDGKLRMGINALAASSAAASSANKITVNPAAGQGNWVFFAITYQASGQTQFFFGNDLVDAIADVSSTYPAGNTGTNISNLSIGASSGAYVDDARVYNSVLTLQEIRGFQHGLEDTIAPTSPGTLSATTVTSTTIGVHWTDTSTDNIAVVAFDVFDGNTLIKHHVPVAKYNPYYNDAFLSNLTPGTTYNLSVKARDSRGNYSPATNTVQVTTLGDGPAPLVWLKLDEATGVVAVNSGSSGLTYYRSSGLPAASDNVPSNIGSYKSADYGTASANAYVESSTEVNELKNMSSFTITGWVNNRSSVMGSGGNRIVSWINNGGEGVELVYQNNGSLRLGVDMWPDNSPAFSSSNKVTTNASAPTTNWVFFAVTYTESGTVEFYFGNNGVPATLDVTKTYSGRGATGSNIGKLAIGNFNDATRSAASIDRMFRGLIDDIRIYGAKLTPQQIAQVQAITGNSGGRISMTPESPIQDEMIDEAALTQNYPNPFDEATNIEVNIPHSVRVARLSVYDLAGRSLQNIVIEGRGPTSVSVSRDKMGSGVYIYTLITDGKIVGYKRMTVK